MSILFGLLTLTLNCSNAAIQTVCVPFEEQNLQNLIEKIQSLFWIPNDKFYVFFKV